MKKILFVFALLLTISLTSCHDPEWVYLKDSGQCYFINAMPNHTDTSVHPDMVYKITTVDCESLSDSIIFYHFKK